MDIFGQSGKEIPKQARGDGLKGRKWKNRETPRGPDMQSVHAGAGFLRVGRFGKKSSSEGARGPIASLFVRFGASWEGRWHPNASIGPLWSDERVDMQLEWGAS